MAKERFPINLLDPKEVQAKMPQVKELLAAKQEDLKALTAQVELLARIVGPDAAAPVKRASGTAFVSGGGTVTARGSKAAPAQDRAVQALEKAGRPMGPTSLYNFMVEQGMDVPDNANTLGANLWSAERAGRIVKAANGVYAPLGSPTDRPLTDYDAAGRNGMPAPSHPQPVEGNPGR